MVCLLGKSNGQFEYKLLSNSSAVISFTLLVENGYGNLIEYIPIPVECWGKKAKYLNSHLRNNDRLSVIGHLRINKQGVMVINADVIDFIDDTTYIDKIES